jgi:hypothetical protein
VHRVRADALGPEVLRVLEQLGREHAVGDDPLVVVQVVDEHVDRPEPLGESGLDATPLRRGDDPRDDVERPGPVDATAVGVHRERDAHGEDVELGERLSLLQFAVLERRQLLDERSCRGARRAVGGEELVPGGRRGAHVCQGHRPTLVEPRCRTITKLCQPCELW